MPLGKVARVTIILHKTFNKMNIHKAVHGMTCPTPFHNFRNKSKFAIGLYQDQICTEISIYFET